MSIPNPHGSKVHQRMVSYGEYRAFHNADASGRNAIPYTPEFANSLWDKRIFFKAPSGAYPQPCNTTVTMPFDLYESIRMPFGWRNTVQTFQRFMDQGLHCLNFAFICNDDFHIARTDEYENRKHLPLIFQRFQKYVISINTSISLVPLIVISMVPCLYIYI